MTLHLAVSRLNGVSCPTNVDLSAEELRNQLVQSKAKALFTCLPLLDTALRAARLAGIPSERVYICDLYGQPSDSKVVDSQQNYKTLNQLIAEGVSLPELVAPKWGKGQAMEQIAFLVYSSGTTGVPVSFEREKHPASRLVYG